MKYVEKIISELLDFKIFGGGACPQTPLTTHCLVYAKALATALLQEPVKYFLQLNVSKDVVSNITYTVRH